MKIPEGVTPPEVAELVKDLIKDKVVCDVGCGGGTFMDALSRYASKVIGIEEEESWARVAVNKGYDVWVGSSWWQPLPEADVYYLWSKDAMGIYLKAIEDGTHGTFIFGKTIRKSPSEFFSKFERRDLKELDWWVYITQL